MRFSPKVLRGIYCPKCDKGVSIVYFHSDGSVTLDCEHELSKEKYAKLKKAQINN